MDSSIGIVGDNYVLVAADSSCARSIYMLSDDEDKVMELDQHLLLATSGDQGDRVQFSEYIQKNIHLYHLRTGTKLSTSAVANFMRGELAQALRSNPYQTNLLLGGFDHDGPSLYYMDYIASMNKLDFGSHGYGSYFILGILDKQYRKGMNLEEGLELMRACISEVQKRFIVKMPSFKIKIVDKDGIRTIE